MTFATGHRKAQLIAIMLASKLIPGTNTLAYLELVLNLSRTTSSTCPFKTFQRSLDFIPMLTFHIR
jgi:hypothetical protein